MFTKKVTLITGASENHKKSLLQFLSTVNFILYDCVVYDLGLHPDSLNRMRSIYPQAIYRTFDYSKYPAYYNITVNAGEYAWKPAIIWEILTEIKSNIYPTEILIWCDAGNKLIDNRLLRIINHISINKIYSPTSNDTIQRWTHPLTCDWFGITHNHRVLSFNNRNGAVLGFNIQEPDVCAFIEEFAYCASIKECIAPVGSSRANHRQDQAVFTILYYRFMESHPDLCHCNIYLDISIHNDID